MTPAPLPARALALRLLAIVLWAGSTAHAAVDVDAMWDYARPAQSEARFRAALAELQGPQRGASQDDDALVLQTQIARTLGLRGRFDEARALLDAIEPSLPSAGPEPRVRALLERGRMLRSSGQPVPARPLFVAAFELADARGLPGLAADALHMVALVEPTLEGQLLWHQRTIDYARASADPKARRWEGPALNNLGASLREAGRLEPSLVAFRQALAAYERVGRADRMHFGRWQVAHTLRRMGRHDEALALLQALAREGEASGRPDPYVFQELALVHDARHEPEAAARSRALRHRAELALSKEPM